MREFLSVAHLTKYSWPEIIELLIFLDNSDLWLEFSFALLQLT